MWESRSLFIIGKHFNSLCNETWLVQWKESVPGMYQIYAQNHHLLGMENRAESLLLENNLSKRQFWAVARSTTQRVPTREKDLLWSQKPSKRTEWLHNRVMKKKRIVFFVLTLLPFNDRIWVSKSWMIWLLNSL